MWLFIMTHRRRDSIIPKRLLKISIFFDLAQNHPPTNLSQGNDHILYKKKFLQCVLTGIFYAVRKMDINQLLNKVDWPRKLMWLLTIKNYAVGKIAMWTNGQKIRASVVGGVWEQGDVHVMMLCIYQMRRARRRARKKMADLLQVPKILQRAKGTAERIKYSSYKNKDLGSDS